MLRVLSCTLVVAIASAIPFFEFSASFDAVAPQFEAFASQYHKIYSSQEETARRAAVFADNLAFIDSWNAQNRTATGVTLAINEFADLSHEEFKAFYLGYKPSLRTKTALAQPCSCEQYGPDTKAGESDYCEDFQIQMCFKYVFGCGVVPGAQHCTNSNPPPTPPPGPTPPTPPPGPTPPTPPAPSGDSIDWVKKGAVTPVKNQAQCGSCWAFSTTGSMEGAIFNKYGVLESLSEQELVSCDKVDHGCQGGSMDNGFTFAKKNGLPLEKDYPYTSGTGNTGTCKSQTFAPANHSKVSSYHDVTANSERDLKAAVAKGPVSVAIEADKQVFQFYKSGVIKSSAGCGTNLDHGVLAVGYGTQDGTMYWKVKNSWGATWGDKGYVLLERTDSTDSAGTCGLAMDASYPIMA